MYNGYVPWYTFTMKNEQTEKVQMELTPEMAAFVKALEQVKEKRQTICTSKISCGSKGDSLGMLGAHICHLPKERVCDGEIRIW